MIIREWDFGRVQMGLCLATVLILLIASQVSATEFPGPDGFGYVAYGTDSNLRDISSDEVVVKLGDDQVSGAIPIPFNFLFYGISHNEVFISSNGFITFSENEVDGWNGGDAVPNVLHPNNFIAGFWEDLNPSAGGVSYASTGDEGNREFVISFAEVPHYDSGFPVTFQIILHEGSNDIELQYGLANSDGGTHSVGIENADGTMGLQIAYGDIALDHEGFLITISRIFEKFDVQKAVISFGRGSELDNYELVGEFILPELSDSMIDPAAEDVHITVGSSNLVIPAGSFKVKRGRYGADFEGWVDGALVHASFEPAGTRTFLYSIVVQKVDLTDSLIPLNFSLRVGTDLGLTTVPLYGDLRSGSNHNYSRLDTRYLDLHKRYNRTFHR